MKGYSKAASHKGKTAYRTPSRWLAGRPEVFKRNMDSKLVARGKGHTKSYYENKSR